MMIELLERVLYEFNTRLEESICINSFFHQFRESAADSYLNEVANWSEDIGKWLQRDASGKFSSNYISEAMTSPGVSQHIENIIKGLTYSVHLIADSIVISQAETTTLAQTNMPALVKEITANINLLSTLVQTYNIARSYRAKAIKGKPGFAQWPALEVAGIDITAQGRDFWTYESWKEKSKQLVAKVPISDRSSKRQDDLKTPKNPTDPEEIKELKERVDPYLNPAFRRRLNS